MVVPTKKGKRMLSSIQNYGVNNSYSLGFRGPKSKLSGDNVEKIAKAMVELGGYKPFELTKMSTRDVIEYLNLYKGGLDAETQALVKKQKAIENSRNKLIEGRINTVQASEEILHALEGEGPTFKSENLENEINTLITEGIKNEKPQFKEAMRQALSLEKSNFDRIRKLILSDFEAGKIIEDEAMAQLSNLEIQLKDRINQLIHTIE